MKIITDCEDATTMDVKKMDRLPGLERLLRRGVAKQIDFGVESLAENLQSALGEVAAILDSVQLESATCEVGEIGFSLAVTTTGEFALLSIAKGSQDTAAGISFKLVPKA